MFGAAVETRTGSEQGRPLSRRSFSTRSTRGKMPTSGTQASAADVGSTIGEDVVFIRLPEVRAITGLSKTSIYELIRANHFPAPVRLGVRSVAWIKAEIRAWAVERVHASRAAA
jgi:prophage regulatory protein